jgi:phosphopantothenoylcysteine decarboxylase/phosphopantothenate--cysteine ligase
MCSFLILRVAGVVEGIKAMLAGKRILMIISGGIAAYKALDVIRRLRDQRAQVRCVLTQNAAEFVTPLSVAALSEEKVYQDLFSLTDESEMGHIRLTRETDLVMVAPATANIIAKMAHGLADDLATTLLLASSAPVMVAPAMNVQMWEHPATQANVHTLAQRGVRIIAPGQGALACGEVGAGRLADVMDIVDAVVAHFTPPAKPLAGKKIIVTSGPTREPIDPVRYISNHSSGKQGHSLAQALADMGADVHLISGPVALPPPENVTVWPVITADEMWAAAQQCLPADAAVCAAAVADWKIANATHQKMKKGTAAGLPVLQFTENPVILAGLAQHRSQRPKLVVGFAAETQNVVAYAQQKLAKKQCDWIIANDVSAGTQTFGGDMNTVTIVCPDGVDNWAPMPKTEVAQHLASKIAGALGAENHAKPL